MVTGFKVVVVSFQNAPKGMPPFLTLAGHPQTTNEKNQFALMVVEACEMDSMKDRNSVLLNKSKDGVVCEVKFKKTLTMSYLGGGNKYLHMPNSNHNFRRTAEVRWLAAHQMHQSKHLWLVHKC